METNQINCQNCDQPFKDGFAFCPHCGQKTNEDLTVGVLFYNTISNYFSFDARFLKSFIPLMVKPGYLAKEFIKGKRLLYLHPAQMYLFISVIFFFIFSFSVRDQVDTLNNNFQEIFDKDRTVALDSVETKQRDSISRVKDSIGKVELKKALKKNNFIIGLNEEQIDSIIIKEKSNNGNLSFSFNQTEIDSLIKAGVSDDEIYKAMGLKDSDGWFQRKIYSQALKFFKARDGGSILKAFYDTIPIALFFLLPIFALIIKVLYFNKGRYAHHLVFSFYYFSYLFMVFTIIFGINLIWDIPDWIDWLIALSTYIYLLLAVKRFYGQGWFLSFFKSGVATFTFMMIVIPTAAVIIGLFAFMFY